MAIKIKILLFINVIFASVVLRGVGQMTILLSMKGSSNDSATCGSTEQPCATFSYALSRLQDKGGVLVIDGGIEGVDTQPYLINASTTVTINGPLSIRKRELTNKLSQEPTVIFDVTYFIQCHGDLTISSIHLKSSRNSNNISILLLSEEAKTLTMANTTLEMPFLIRSSYHRLFIEIKNTTVTEFHYICERWNCLSLFNTTIISMSATRNESYFVLINSYLMGGTLVYFREASFLSKFAIIFSKFFNVEIGIETDVLVLIQSNFTSLLFQAQRCHTVIINCTFDISSFSVSHTKKTVISESTFKNLPSSLPGYKAAINIRSNVLWISNCLFQNNSKKSIYPSAMDIKTYSLKFFNVKIIGNQENVIRIRVHPWNYSQWLPVRHLQYNIDKTKIRCLAGKFIDHSYFRNTNELSLLVSCRKCPPTTYTVTPAVLQLHNNIFLKYQILVFYSWKFPDCVRCPFGGSCLGEIKSKGGYWGYRPDKDQSKVVFVPCPTSYCCATMDTCFNFKTCFPNRVGRLCSQCQQGFTCSIIGQPRCVENKSCNQKFLNVFLYIAAAFSYLCILLYLQEIKYLFKRLFFGKTKIHPEERTQENEDADNDTMVKLNERLLPECFERGIEGHTGEYHMLLSTNIPHAEYNTTNSIMSGSLKVLFFFYQAASIMRVETSEKYKIPLIMLVNSISSIFNIRPDIRYSSFTACFLPDLQSLHIQYLKIGYTAVMVLLVAILLTVTKILDYYQRRSRQPNVTLSCWTKRIDKNVPSYNKLPFEVRLKCSYLQILLIGFAGISTIAFKSVYCVQINYRHYLFVQATVECYQTWQIALWVFIAFWILPFPIALYMSYRKLYECMITPTEFLLYVTFPPAIPFSFIYRWLFQKDSHVSMTITDAMLSKHLLMIVSEPFRELQDGSQICWESIFIIRRIVLIIIHTFMTSSISKVFPTVIVLICCLAHTNIYTPYKDSILNTLEKASLLSLLSLCFVNVFWGINNEYNLMGSVHYRKFGQFMLYYEVLLLSLPFIVLILRVFAYILNKAFILLKRFFSSKQE